jgi:hypothetical protein
MKRIRRRSAQTTNLTRRLFTRGRRLHFESLEDRRLLAADFGDAPDVIDDPSGNGFTVPGYPTLLADDGARHEIVAGGPFLGTAPDDEADGQPSADAGASGADGDDGDGNDDEDGVTGLDVPMTPGGTHDITVDVTVPSGGTALLNAWIDFNFDGDWDDDGEQVFTDLPLATGSHDLSFAVPEDVVYVDDDGVFPAAGSTGMARFRLSSQSGLLPTGLANDGEVEDYSASVAAEIIIDERTIGIDGVGFAVITLPPGTGFSDLDIFTSGALLSTELANAIADTVGASATARQQLIDDTGGLTNLEFLTTNISLGINAENALIAAVEDFRDQVEAATGRTLLGDVIVASTFHQCYELFGDVLDQTGDIIGEQLGALTGNVTVVQGEADITFYQVSADFEFAPLDFGDAPDVIVDVTDLGSTVAGYPTLLADDGARHEIVVGGPFLGTAPDDEADGQPSDDASGDDEDIGTVAISRGALAPGSTGVSGGGTANGLTGGEPDASAFRLIGSEAVDVDDEDGVTGLDVPMTPGGTHDITVDVSVTGGGTAFLNAWLDFNFDGDWDDDGEQIFTDEPLATGSHDLSFAVPEDVVYVDDDGVFPAVGATGMARFRLSSQSGLLPTGLANDGEVEDYSASVAAEIIQDNRTIDIHAVAFGSVALPPGTGFANLEVSRSAALLTDELANLVADAAGATATGRQHLIDNYGGLTKLEFLTSNISTGINAEEALIAAVEDFRSQVEAATGRTLLGDVNSSVLSVPNYELFGGLFDEAGNRLGIPLGAITGDLTVFSGQGAVTIYQVSADFEFAPADFGDAPDGITVGGVPRNYPTLLVNDGALHEIDPDGPYFGDFAFSLPDAEVDGQPDAAAEGDDAANEDDENQDGFLILGQTFVPGEQELIGFHFRSLNSDAFVNFWVDWNNDGDWDEADEHVFDDMPVAASPGTSFDQFINVPATAVAGTTFARGRISTQSCLDVTGPAPDGEVEDFAVTVEEAEPEMDEPGVTLAGDKLTIVGTDEDDHVVVLFNTNTTESSSAPISSNASRSSTRPWSVASTSFCGTGMTT